MKKEIGLLLLFATSLTGCLGTSDSSAIGAARGVNPAMLSNVLMNCMKLIRKQLKTTPPSAVPMKQ